MHATVYIYIYISLTSWNRERNADTYSLATTEYGLKRTREGLTSAIQRCNIACWWKHSSFWLIWPASSIFKYLMHNYLQTLELSQWKNGKQSVTLSMWISQRCIEGIKLDDNYFNIATYIQHTLHTDDLSLLLCYSRFIVLNLDAKAFYCLTCCCWLILCLCCICLSTATKYVIL